MLLRPDGDPGSRGRPPSTGAGLAPQPRRGAPFVARRAVNLHGCACSAQAWRPVARAPGSSAQTPAATREGTRSTGLQGPIPSDPGIREPLHPRRLRCPPSPYRSGYASFGRLAGRGASALSVHGLFGNGSLEAGQGFSRTDERRQRAGAWAPPSGKPKAEPAEAPPFVGQEAWHAT